jgi:hypothetical protein
VHRTCNCDVVPAEHMLKGESPKQGASQRKDTKPPCNEDALQPWQAVWLCEDVVSLTAAVLNRRQCQQQVQAVKFASRCCVRFHLSGQMAEEVLFQMEKEARDSSRRSALLSAPRRRNSSGSDLSVNEAGKRASSVGGGL